MCRMPWGISRGRLRFMAPASQGWARYSRHWRAADSSSRSRQCGGGRSGRGSCANTSSAISTTSCSSPLTCRYRDIAETPSSAPSRRMVRAASPSASARVTAARTIRARWAVSSSAAERRPLPVAGRAATTVPTPGTARTRHSCPRVASTLLAVAMATPHRWVMARVEGTRSPGRSSPRSMRPRSSAAIRAYGACCRSVIPPPGALVRTDPNARGDTATRAPPPPGPRRW